VGATTGTLPPTQGVALPGSRTATGGVNSGYPDSFCAPNTSDMTAPPREGVTQDALGTDAPAYDEVGEPTGDYAGLQPKGVMMIVHGGGWFVVGSGQVQVTRDEADRWRARGWRTVSVTYHACADAVKDVLWFHDRVRALYGDAIPLCMTGGSAGGHLALVTAYARPDVACVIDRGGPVDAATLKDERAWSDTDAAGQLDGPRWAYNLMTAAWGQDNLPWYSPALFKIPARVLVGVAAHDPYVPYDQALELADKLHARNPAAYVDTVRLANGTVPWVHASVDQAAVDDFDRREQDLVAPLIAQG
jgi:acetyl esterase/lipase